MVHIDKLIIHLANAPCSLDCLASALADLDQLLQKQSVRSFSGDAWDKRAETVSDVAKVALKKLPPEVVESWCHIVGQIVATAPLITPAAFYDEARAAVFAIDKCLTLSLERMNISESDRIDSSLFSFCKRWLLAVPKLHSVFQGQWNGEGARDLVELGDFRVIEPWLTKDWQKVLLASLQSMLHRRVSPQAFEQLTTETSDAAKRLQDLYEGERMAAARAIVAIPPVEPVGAIAADAAKEPSEYENEVSDIDSKHVELDQLLADTSLPANRQKADMVRRILKLGSAIRAAARIATWTKVGPLVKVLVDLQTQIRHVEAWHASVGDSLVDIVDSSIFWTAEGALQADIESLLPWSKSFRDAAVAVLHQILDKLANAVTDAAPSLALLQSPKLATNDEMRNQVQTQISAHPMNAMVKALHEVVIHLKPLGRLVGSVPRMRSL